MAEKTTTTNALNVMQKVLLVTNELKVKKNGKNTFSKFEYFKLEDILDELNPLLLKHGLFMTYSLTKKNYDNESQIYVSSLVLKNAENPEDKVEYTADIDKADMKGATNIQMSGATLTYGKRWAVMNAFNLAENDDPDNDEVNVPVKTQPKNNTADKFALTVTAFDTMKVSKDKLLNFLKKPEEAVTAEDIAKLNAIGKEIKAKTKTVEEVFGA